jgi:hypothetical protein
MVMVIVNSLVLGTLCMGVLSFISRRGTKEQRRKGRREDKEKIKVVLVNNLDLNFHL